MNDYHPNLDERTIMKMTKRRKPVGVLAELQEMYRRANEWEKPYEDYPGKWTREASHVACPIIAKIMRLLERQKHASHHE